MPKKLFIQQKSISADLFSKKNQLIFPGKFTKFIGTLSVNQVLCENPTKKNNLSLLT